MLRELYISNVAVIADARIELARGLNCFTGATGAGKSLVIGAIEVLLGLRSGGEMLRPGAEEGRVSGVFEIDSAQLLREIERLTDVPVGRDQNELLLTRRLYASGRSSITLNGHPITLSMLKQMGESLVDIHGQHDHQFLLKPSNQLDLLDQFGDVWPLRIRYHEAYQKLVEARARLDELAASQELRRQQLELYRFQAAEIDAAALNPGEYQHLQARAAVLSNLEKLKNDAGGAHAQLYEIDGSVLERLKSLSSVISQLSGIDTNLKGIAEALRDSSIQLEEAAFDLARYLSKLDVDPAELAQINERLNAIQRVLQKYGQSIEATLAFRQQIGHRIHELQGATEDLASLQQQLTPMRQELNRLGEELAAARRAAAGKLAPRVQKQLAALGMEQSTFQVSLSPASGSEVPELSQATPSGFDQIEFIAQTNPGQLALPLRKIASGGELSRIMLALKDILAASDRISVLVFDEIDANVGGRLGSVIGRKLRQLADHHQVLCITHLPQIAAYADRHLTVRKHSEGDQTMTMVREVSGVERVQELAEMIGGRHTTHTSRAQAQELLETAEADFAVAAAKPGRPRGAGRVARR